MILQAIFFYLLAGVLVASAFMVVASRNPVHSVLFLILCFFNAAGLFVMLGAEFLAMILVVVYVGAVAVLFLFVVMMLDVDYAELRKGLLQFMPIGASIGLILLIELILGIATWATAPEMAVAPAAPTPTPDTHSNVAALGAVLYTDYVFFFQLGGLILLVAMIGAIVMTLRHKAGVKRQDIAAQVARTRADSIEVRKVESGKGI